MKITIAEIGELGGIQTDANANKQLDAEENLKNYDLKKSALDIKTTETGNKHYLNERAMMLKEKELVTRNALKEKELQIAKENTSASEIKAKKGK